MATFDSRRKLTRSDLAQMVGAGVGTGVAVGLVTAYVTRLFVQRERIRGGGDAAAPAVVSAERGGE
jgi:hypothetical protein